MFCVGISMQQQQKKLETRKVENCVFFRVSRNTAIGFRDRRSCSFCSLQSGIASPLCLKWYTMLYLVVCCCCTGISFSNIRKQDLIRVFASRLMQFSQTSLSMDGSFVYFALSNVLLMFLGAFKYISKNINISSS